MQALGPGEPLVEVIAANARTVRHFVPMSDRVQMPATTSNPGLECYEGLSVRALILFPHRRGAEASAGAGPGRAGPCLRDRTR